MTSDPELRSSGRPVRTPFRILPSRACNVGTPWIVTAVCCGLSIGGIAIVVLNPQDGNGLAAIMTAVGIFGAVIGLRSLRREMRRFGPGAEYWMEIAVEHFGLITPDTADRCPWAEIEVFEVQETKFTDRRGRHVGSGYGVVGLFRRYHLEISLEDFATGLGTEDKDRAAAICAVLNGLRDQALASAGRDFDFAPPPGLVVTDKRPPKMPSERPVPSVVSRQ